MIFLFATVLFLSSLLSPPPVEAVNLDFESGKTYGILDEKPGIEVTASMTDSSAQSFASSFASAGIYVKVTNPPPAFTSTQTFSILNGVAGGWYLTLKEGADSLAVIDSFTKATSKQVVVEVVPFGASFIKEIKAKYPAVKVHTAGYFYWPREDVKAALSQVQPPTLEAISMRVESGTSGDMFADVRLMFDTFFDAAADIPGTSIKINYPPNTILSLSDIKPKHSGDYMKTAYRLAVAAANGVASVQHQKKSNKAPYRYIVMGSFTDLSSSGVTIVSRFARFLSLKPNIIWPLAVSGNGGPFDPSKPVIGIIGIIEGKTEGVIVNTSSGNVSVTLPYAVSANAYSSHVGSFIPTTSLQLSPYETIIFGEHISRSTPPPPTQPPRPTAAPPTNPPRTLPSPTTAPLHPTTARPQPTSALPFPMFPTSTPVPFQITPPFSSLPSEQPGASNTQWKPSVKLAVVKADSLFKLPILVFQKITSADRLLEDTLLSLFQTALNRMGVSF